MISEAIILAGGFGTRLRGVIKDIPKPMAPVNERPFLQYLLDYLYRFSVQKVILSVGYRHESIRDYFGDEYRGVELIYSVEDTPLGTGGAIWLALLHCKSNNVLVLNGDTFFGVNLRKLEAFHLHQKSALTIATKSLRQFDRYGTMKTNGDRIEGFIEKQPTEEGFVNGGVYLLNKEVLSDLELPEKFSFEKEVLEKQYNTHFFAAFTDTEDAFFIDIGIPEDYELAQNNPEKLSYQTGWTLFLDRDGVINKRKVGDYIRKWDEFSFLGGVLLTLDRCSADFDQVVVVTNQQGIGKGLMSEADLAEIHQKMRQKIWEEGGRVDEVYYCPRLASENPACRKPNTGMAQQAQTDFPQIDFNKSIMVGDSPSDMEFGKNVGMFTVFIGEKTPNNASLADFVVKDLPRFQSLLKELMK